MGVIGILERDLKNVKAFRKKTVPCFGVQQNTKTPEFFNRNDASKEDHAWDVP